jgi:hypothetical protein
MINLFPIYAALRKNASMLAPTVIFARLDALLALNPEHASSLEKMPKDIKRMKYWMRVIIG